MKIDKFILTGLAKGLTQEEIASSLKKEGIKPNSISSVEKELRIMKKEHGAKTLFHLAIIVKSENIV